MLHGLAESNERSPVIEASDRLLEHVLVVRCQTGDQAALAELINRYQPRLRYFLRKMLGDADAADDILQEVWCDVWRSISRLTEPSAFSAWVYRIARDRVYRFLRKRRMTLLPMELADELAGADTTGSNDEFSAEDAADVNAALDQLAPVHREVLVLRFLEQMSYDEIARATNSRLGTVRSRVHYAKRALRRALKKAGRT